MKFTGLLEMLRLQLDEQGHKLSPKQRASWAEIYNLGSLMICEVEFQLSQVQAEKQRVAQAQKNAFQERLRAEKLAEQNSQLRARLRFLETGEI